MPIISTNVARTLVWKHVYDVKLWRHNSSHKYKWPPYATEWTPSWKFSVYATGPIDKF